MENFIIGSLIVLLFLIPDSIIDSKGVSIIGRIFFAFTFWLCFGMALGFIYLIGYLANLFIF